MSHSIDPKVKRLSWCTILCRYFIYNANIRIHSISKKRLTHYYNSVKWKRATRAYVGTEKSRLYIGKHAYTLIEFLRLTNIMIGLENVLSSVHEIINRHTKVLSINM